MRAVRPDFKGECLEQLPTKLWPNLGTVFSRSRLRWYQVAEDSNINAPQSKRSSPKVNKVRSSEVVCTCEIGPVAVLTSPCCMSNMQ